MEKEHEFCLRCGRRLKTMENRIRGYGDTCFKKRKAVRVNALFDINKQKGGIDYERKGKSHISN